MVSHYSPFSVYQEDTKLHNLPEDHITGFLTPECIQDILSSAHQASERQTEAILEVIAHLSWGDIKVSHFFLHQLIKYVKFKKGAINMLKFHFNLI